MPIRTNKSVPLYLRETLSVVGHSLPILMVQGLVVLALVFVDQGRAFLVIESSINLAYLITAGAVVTVVFARVLARRVDVEQTDDTNATDRIRWLALQTGSGIAGLSAGFLPAAVIERFAATHACSVPVEVLNEYRFAAVVTARGVTLVFIAYLVWRINARRGEGTRTRDVLLAFGVIYLASAAIRLSHDYYLLILGILLVASSLLLAIPVLVGPAPDRSRGGRMEWRAWTLAAMSIVAGLFVAFFPEKLPSGVSLWVIVQFWIAAALLVTVGLRWSFKHSLPAFTAALLVLADGVYSFWDHAFHARPFRIANQTPAPRPLLSDYVRQWIQQRSSATEPYPIILVSASGGGIRAAYWTASLLAGIQDREPNFANHVLGVSAVSGGSVGAAVFRSLVANACHDCRKQAEHALARDFLAPALTSLLTRDVATAAMPVLPVSDRGIALERAFENAWQDATSTPTLATGFNGHAAANGTSDLPLLFLNSTEAGSAKRAVFSDVSFIGVPTLDQNIQKVVQSKAVTLSTAMILSARFPYISPEASLPGTTFRFVDGGYFDNSGAATVIDVVHAVRQAVSALHPRTPFRIVVLQVQNEPTEVSRCEEKKRTGGFSTPLEILDELRSQRSVNFASQLQTELPQHQGHQIITNLTPQGGNAEFPLGWTLPESTRKEIHNQITARLAETSTPLGLLMESLRTRVTTAESGSVAQRSRH